MLHNLIDEDRVRVIGNILVELGFEGIVKFDLEEPEYKAFRKMCEDEVSPEYIGLIALSAGTVDYQLGMGGAYRFWESLIKAYSEAKVVKNIDDAEKIMYRFMDMPVNRRLYNQKLNRIGKIFRSGFAKWFLKEYDSLCNEPIKVWEELSSTLFTGMEKKTMVFAMKAWDLSNLACYETYLNFPWNIPIPVDLHIRNVTVSSGIMKRYAGDEVFRDAWTRVLKIVRDKLDKNITLLRMDSLVWQTGKIMYKEMFNKEKSLKSLYKYFINKIKLDENISKRLAHELIVKIELI